MVFLFWSIGFVLAVILSGSGVVPDFRFIPIAGIAPALVAAIPSIIGTLGSLFGTKRSGKPTEYTAMLDPLGQDYRKALMRRAMMGMGNPVSGYGQSAGYRPTMDMMNMLASMFQKKGGNYQG